MTKDLMLNDEINLKNREILMLCNDLKNELKYNLKNTNEKENRKKRIAVIYDIDGWAFHNIATQIQKNLSNEFHIDIIPVSVFNDNIVKLIFLAHNYDLVHCLWRGLISCIENQYEMEYINNLGLSISEFEMNYIKKINFTTSVYDHNFLTDDTLYITKNFLKYIKDYTVSSNCLMKIYESSELEKKPSSVISDGVDLKKFQPKNLDRYNNIHNRKIVIGWVGNSKFLDSEKDEDLKGLRGIIMPVLNDLIEQGQNIEIKFADRNKKFIPHNEMPEYYDSIDLYICASKTEGTPNPVLEAMAMGVPIISTDVGIVREAFGKEQKEFILKSRTTESLKNKLMEIINNKQILKKLSIENMEQIKKWSWEIKCEQFRDFFRKNLN